jgi:2-C-methyl-D-erythritol 4-phosphate cytidylyltransferase/2-C-methyl-D-erythritol 2,4-cyclodiphosphate synthase
MNIAVILAAGLSSRYNKSVPKQYDIIESLMVIEYSIIAFLNSSNIDKICLVIRQQHYDYFKIIEDKYPNLDIVFGGENRQESVYNAVIKYENHNCSFMLLHDAARPLISQTLIDKLFAATDFDAVIPYLPIYDSLRQNDNKVIILNRENYIRIQTPQLFNYKTLLAAHLKFLGMNMTDDSILVEKLKGSISYIEGEELNFKITNNDNYLHAKMLLNKQFITKIGQGYDVHKYDNIAGDHKIYLGGIALPSKYKIIAHSDGDVLLHAIADSLLGALGVGDIGEFFPDSDPQYKNKKSSYFLVEILKILTLNKAVINNIDATIICEEPKIAKFRNDIKISIANILKIDSSLISVKATTTEGLGYNGRCEGITVIANSLIRKYDDN